MKNHKLHQPQPEVEAVEEEEAEVEEEEQLLLKKWSCLKYLRIMNKRRLTKVKAH